MVPSMPSTNIPRLASGSVTLFFLGLLIVVILLAHFIVHFDKPGRDERMADEIKDCIVVGGEPVVRGRVVRCAVRKAAV